MTNTGNAEAYSVRKDRARYLHQLCTAERWSGRAIALESGVPHSTIANMLNGKSPLDIDDIGMFARILKMNPGELTVKLLEVDSNHQPAGFKPHRFMTLDEFINSTAPAAHETGHLARVTPIRKAPKVGQDNLSHAH